MLTTLLNKFLQVPIVMWNELLRMWWFVLLGILLGALIKTYKLDRKLYKVLNKHEVSMIFLATFIGLMSPLCSCGILPVVITLIECGIPLAPVMALFITSPIMSPDALIITNGVLGQQMAIAKLTGAVIMGLGAGFTTYFLQKINFFETDVLKIKKFMNSCIVKAKDLENAKPGEIPIDTKLAENKLEFFYKRAKELFRYIVKFILIAAFIEAIMIVFIPDNWITDYLGKNSVFSPVWAALIGIPMPVNGISVVPILKGLIEKGMSIKAAITFMIAGPVTSIPAIVALNGMFKKRVVIVFLLLSLLGSITLGYMLG